MRCLVPRTLTADKFSDPFPDQLPFADRYDAILPVMPSVLVPQHLYVVITCSHST